jgi:hypothetical protein
MTNHDQNGAEISELGRSPSAIDGSREGDPPKAALGENHYSTSYVNNLRVGLRSYDEDLRFSAEKQH